MRLLRYFKGHGVAVCAILALLTMQAFCDLALPRYTSDLVDVGIQQLGVEDASTGVMTVDTYDGIMLLLSAEDGELVARCYDAPDVTKASASAGNDAGESAANASAGNDAPDAGESAANVSAGSATADALYHLNDYGRAHRAQLNDAIEFPLVVVNAIEEGHMDASSMGFDLQTLESRFDDGTISKQQIEEMLDGIESSMVIRDDLVEQQALAAAVSEYARAGVDTSQMQVDYMLRTGAIMMGFVTAGVIIAALVSLLASRTGAKIGRKLRSDLFERVVSFSDAEVQKFSVASLITRGTNDIQQIQMVSIMALRMILYAPILAIGGIVMVTQTNPSISWTIVVGVLAVLVVVTVLFAVSMPKFKIMQTLIDKVNLISREMLTGVSVVRAFGRQEYEQSRFERASEDLMGVQLFTNRVMTFMMPAMMLIMNGVSVLIVWVAGGAIDSGAMQTGDMIAFITYSMVIISSFLMLGMLAIVVPRAEVAAKRIDEVLETQPSIVDPAGASASTGAIPADASVGADVSSDASTGAIPAGAISTEGGPTGARIEFDRVCFKYDGSDENALDDISFVAEAGKTTAIIGPTGSGKTSIMKLIERFYDVSSGSVRLDGVDVRNMKQSDLRAQLGYVPQKAFLMSGTIASNVGYAKGVGDGPDDGPADNVGNVPASGGGGGIVLSKSEEASIRRALSIAQAESFVDEREEGIASPIAQGGTNVSGGQRQRLAIARAVASDARAYLFDDSFSALDYKTDAALRNALATEMNGKTVVIVAQRIATVLNADKIVVLDEGRVVGQGTHAELLNSCETYREIAYSQLSAEELEGGGAS